MHPRRIKVLLLLFKILLTQDFRTAVNILTMSLKDYINRALLELDSTWTLQTVIVCEENIKLHGEDRLNIQHTGLE